jgi:thiol-disulfide isomerase/thioredoxin
MSAIAFKFWSPTCEPCKAIAPSIEALKEDFPEVEWRSVNIKNDPDGFTEAFSVTMVPTIVVATRQADGTLRAVARHTGTQMAQ